MLSSLYSSDQKFLSYLCFTRGGCLISGSLLGLFWSFFGYFFLESGSSSIQKNYWRLCAMVLPTNSQPDGVKGISSFSLEEQQLPTLAQTVQQCGICLRRTALAVVLFQSEMRNMQLQYLKISVLLEMILGKILVRQQLVSQISYSGPQMNTFFRTECPWKSMKKVRRERNSCFKLLASVLIAFTYGISNPSQLVNILLRSLPPRLVLKLPSTTPSGLTIGITLNTMILRRYLACSSSEQMNQRKPLTMQLPHVYPGWIRAATRMHLLLSLGIVGSVTVSKGRSNPPSDSANISSLTIGDSEVDLFCSAAIMRRLSVYVNGGQQASCTSQSLLQNSQSKLRQLQVIICALNRSARNSYLSTF